MAIQTLNTIKNWFKTNLKPTQAQFWDTWDSFRHKQDKVPSSDVEGLDDLLINKLDNELFDHHLTDEDAHNIFIKKNERAFVSIGGNGDLLYLHDLPITFENANIMISGGIGIIKGLTLYPEAKNYQGKIYTLTNKQTNDVVLLHEDATASVGFTFSNAQDYTCKPNEVVTFRFNSSSKFEMVASSMPSAGVSSWNDLTGKPTTFAPSTHSHAISEVTGLATELGTKEDKTQKGVAGGYVPLDTFTKIASQYLTIVNDLVTGGATALLSAEQGKQLKTQIDAINTLLTSNDINLDTVQELVDAIKTVQTSLSAVLVNDLTTGGTTKALTAEMGKTLKGFIDALNVNNITITTAVSITTDTTDSSGYGQNGRNVMIPNGANAINLSCEITSAANFVASYTKLGISAITFIAGASATLVLVDGSAVLNGAVGSTACLTRTGNTYYLQISNR